MQKIVIKSSAATILEALRNMGINIPAICGGRGVCGKCAIKFFGPAPTPKPEETKYFTKEALAEGFRLACLTPAKEGAVIEIHETESSKGFFALDLYTPQLAGVCDRYSIIPFNKNARGLDRHADGVYDIKLGILRKLAHIDSLEDSNEISALYDNAKNAILDIFTGPAAALGIAVDIGTTTIAMELIDLVSGKKVCSYSAINSQRALGADVITRIGLASGGKQNELNKYIISDLQNGVSHLIKSAAIKSDNIYTVHIAGNTTMLHLLLNVNCHKLGQFPFTPPFTGYKDYSWGEIFQAGPLDCEVVLFPGISAFVGADIVAGMAFCGISRDKPCILIDLGTNGEMVLYSKDFIYATSTAAGPAFEAGNISCGMASVTGAIAKIDYNKEADEFICETIGGAPPIGICGTGALDMAALLVKYGFADETGLLEDNYFDEGVCISKEAGIVFTQKDLREIQLAKSAVRAGMEILLLEAGIGYNDIGQVFLAGGFGHKINLDSACTLGIIPGGIKDKVITVGNSSLGGCIRALTSKEALNDMVMVSGSATEIALSAHPKFNDLYMEYMMF